MNVDKMRSVIERSQERRAEAEVADWLASLPEDHPIHKTRRAMAQITAAVAGVA
jgi:hypothetical protein